MTSRTALSLQEKINLINDFEKSKMSVAEFAKKKMVPLSSAKKIFKKKTELRAEFEKGESNNGRKRKRDGIHAEMEEALYLL